MTFIKDNKVSFDDEKLILVNESDEIVGFKDKISCHLGQGILHRAFSIFIFNENDQLLLQRRSEQKQLWPLYWSNSCCSHPRQGEWIERSTLRRLREELGLTTDLKFLYKFQYQASFFDAGSENEICSVFIGKFNGEVRPNASEIAEWKFIDISELDADLTSNPDEYTPWFKMEWEKIRSEFWSEIENL